jgi:hypothetical protein
VDAYNQDWPVLEPDLAHPETPRWLAFAPAAVAGGVRAVFGFPLQVGSVRLGALNLCRDQAGRSAMTSTPMPSSWRTSPLRPSSSCRATSRSGELASELGAGADFHYVVHQASGMVAAQLGVSVRDALVRLRAYAFGNDRSLTDVAKEVVDRKLRFDDPTRRGWDLNPR